MNYLNQLFQGFQHNMNRVFIALSDELEKLIYSGLIKKIEILDSFLGFQSVFLDLDSEARS